MFTRKFICYSYKSPFLYFKTLTSSNLESKSSRTLTYFQHQQFFNKNSIHSTEPITYFAVYNKLYRSINPINIPTYSTSSEKDNSTTSKVDHIVAAESSVKLSQKTRLKQAVRDYGATIIVFHVAISLASLGFFYLAISNGMDAVRILTFLGFSDSVISSKVALGGSTFVIAYAVHKVFAPVRIGITLSVAPFIVRYLRRINLLKPPKKA